MVLNSWFLAVPPLILIALSMIQVRRYLRRAQSAYIAEGATYSKINTTLTETVEGARTVEAMGLARRRLRSSEDDIAVSAQAERYGLTLRNLLFSIIDFAFNAPRVIIVLTGAYGYTRGWVTIGQITAAVLYAEALSGPLDRLIAEIDRLQVGVASTSRLLGIAEVPPDRTPGDQLPGGSEFVARDLRFAYRDGHDVLHGVDLELSPGERLAVVGPSGSGKSTMARLLAGINKPRTGSVQVGGVELFDLPLEQLRTEVALVTQEHYVFVGSVRDNILLAREGSDDAAVWAALGAVGSADWVRRLPAGLDTLVGSGNQALTPAQAQQVALARWIIADPHTLVLDEATSLIDPRTARSLEGSMNALLEGRTVVAIAHRLHTAHDADRIAVVSDGRIAELGSHSELVELDGQYAALWRAWTS
jgi:ABC-type multidrug transport system fused ATPase/permease subunit